MAENLMHRMPMPLEAVLEELGTQFLDELSEYLATQITVIDLLAVNHVSFDSGSLELPVPTAKCMDLLKKYRYPDIIQYLLRSLHLPPESMSLFRSHFETEWLMVLADMVERGNLLCHIEEKHQSYTLQGPGKVLILYKSLIAAFHVTLMTSLIQALPIMDLVAQGRLGEVEHNPKAPTALHTYIETMAWMMAGIRRADHSRNIGPTAVINHTTVVRERSRC